MASFVKKYKKEERSKVPEVEKLVATLTTQCIVAIEEDSVDTIIFGCPAVQVYIDEVRQELDKKGFSEVPIINGLYAAVEMAKALVNMKLTQVPRAYPSDALKVRPAFR
jgi:Asp/Glu/hydantoin racemase